MRPLACALLAIFHLLLAERGYGAGFEFPDNGTQALGRAGAFTAKADDLTAIHYNVAGLARLRGTHLLLDFNMAELSASFTRSGVYPDDSYLDASHQLVTQPWSGKPYPTVREKRGINLIPIGGVATDFGLRRFTFAVGGSGPSSVGIRAYPEEVTLADGTRAPAPQRFDLVDENVIIAFITFAAAWRPVDWLHVGAAFHWGISHAIQHLYAVAYMNSTSCRNSEAWACSFKAGTDIWDPWTPTGSLGVLARIPRLERLEIGLAFRLPYNTDASGKGSFTLPPALQGFAIEARGARLQSKMPYVVRAGARWIFGSLDTERGDVEVDVVYEGWSRVKTFDTTFSTNLGDIEVTVPHNYKNTVSTRIGGAFTLPLGSHKHHRLTLRGGAFYDQGAAPLEWTRLDFDAYDRTGFAVGASHAHRGITVSTAFSYQFTLPRTVENSKVLPIYAIGEPPEDAPGLNGRFESRQWILSVGFAMSLDGLRSTSSGRR